MRIIGVTGPTGAGKSLICEYFRELNIPCIDADEVYHSLLIPPSECLDALRAAFGDGIFLFDGSLNRAALGAIVFSSQEKLKLLNETVLGRVISRLRLIIEDYGREGFETVVVDAPTLIESGFHLECTAVVSVLAPADQRLTRIMARDGLTEERAKQRINAQNGDDFYREHSQYIVINNQNPQELRAKVAAIVASISSVGKE